MMSDKNQCAAEDVDVHFLFLLFFRQSAAGELATQKILFIFRIICCRR